MCFEYNGTARGQCGGGIPARNLKMPGENCWRRKTPVTPNGNLHQS